MADPTASFTDAEDREWSLRITAGRSTDILETCGVDLSWDKLEQALLLMASSDKKFVQVLWILVEKQANADGVTPEDFADALDGDALDEALEALKAAIVNFSRRAIRPLVSQMLTGVEKLQTAACSKAKKMIATEIEKQEKNLNSMTSMKTSPAKPSRSAKK